MVTPAVVPVLSSCRPAYCCAKVKAVLHTNCAAACIKVPIGLRELGENQVLKVARFLPVFYNDIMPFFCIKMHRVIVYMFVNLL